MQIARALRQSEGTAAAQCPESQRKRASVFKRCGMAGRWANGSPEQSRRIWSQVASPRARADALARFGNALLHHLSPRVIAADGGISCCCKGPHGMIARGGQPSVGCLEARVGQRAQELGAGNLYGRSSCALPVQWGASLPPLRRSSATSRAACTIEILKRASVQKGVSLLGSLERSTPR